MPQLSETIAASPLTLLEYGVSGSGKTTLWARLAEFEAFRPIWCSDWDLRLRAIQATLKPELFQHIYFDEFRDKVVGGESYITLENISRNLPMLDKKYGVAFKTIVIDSGTFMMDGIMARALTLGGRDTKSTPQLQDYMAQQSMLRDLIQRFTSCGRHFIFTAHEESDKDEVTGRMFKNLALTGKSAQKTPGYFNELWHCEVKLGPPDPANPQLDRESTFGVRTRSDAIYSARTSYKFLNSFEQQGQIWQKIVKSMETTKPTEVVNKPIVAI